MIKWSHAWGKLSPLTPLASWKQRAKKTAYGLNGKLAAFSRRRRRKRRMEWAGWGIGGRPRRKAIVQQRKRMAFDAAGGCA